MRLTFLGVRGSTGAPGRDFVRYGGHTSCVAVSPRSDRPPDLVLDAGTGLAGLTALLGNDPYRGSILVSHLHWDHVQGLPFCRAVDREDAVVRVYVPAQDGATALQLLSQAMSPPSFPITPEGLGGTWTFTAIVPGTVDVSAYSVVATEVAHKGGRTYGYRVERDGVSIGYVPDHVPAAGISDTTREALAGVDVLIHDAQFLEPERSLADAYGHSTVGDAIDLAVRLQARQLVLFHHGPSRTDDRLDAIGHDLDGASERAGDVQITVAHEGQVLDVSPG